MSDSLGAGPNREEMLYMLFGLGFSVPTHGTIDELYKNAVALYDSQEQFDTEKGGSLLEVVVYDSLKPGAPSNKMALNDAKTKCDNGLYAAQFVPNTRDGVTKSWRFVAVGDKHFWLEYTSTDSWRANGDKSSVRLLPADDAALVSNKYGIGFVAASIKVPFYAIDFVPTYSLREILAVDFDLNPDVSNTPISRELTDDQIKSLIAKKAASIK